MENPRPTLRRAIDWIAVNDEPTDLNIESVKNSISVVLIAELWHEDPKFVASCIVRRRKAAAKAEKEGSTAQFFDQCYQKETITKEEL